MVKLFTGKRSQNKQCGNVNDDGQADPLSGKQEEVLWIKGSGGDLGSIKLTGLAALYMKKLHGLEQLPATGFMVSCFPVKIEKASAGWCRAVAIIDG